jgi:hypothetical protein
VRENLLGARETPDVTVEQLALDHVKEHGHLTSDPADLSVLARTLVALQSQALTEQMPREAIRKVVQEKWT